MALLMMMLACSGAKDSSGASTDSDQTTTTVDSGTDSGTDSGSASGNGAITGTVSATVPGAKGQLYLAVFDKDPFQDPTAIGVVNGEVKDVDLTNGATDTYRVEEVPLRSEAYFIGAFIDVNGNYSTSPSPDSGDIVAVMDGMVPYSVTVDTANVDVKLDLVFNLIRP